MLTPLRRQMATLLAACPACRKPALRRSDSPGYLLATDLPLAAEAADVSAFQAAAEAAGWHVAAQAGWLLLDHPLPPPVDSGRQTGPGEVGCVLWLARLHPQGGAPEADIRALAKAVESGDGAVERLCRSWHRQWAARLRCGEALPGGLAPYLSQALDLLEQRRLQA